MFSRLKFAIFISAMTMFVGVVFVEAKKPVAPQAGDTVSVKMTAEHKFVPEKIIVKVGQTVEWVNAEEGGIHQVTDDADIATDPADVSLPDGAEPFDSKLIKSGKSYQHKFTVAGVYKVTCPPHENAGMMGQVTVTK